MRVGPEDISVQFCRKNNVRETVCRSAVGVSTLGFSTCIQTHHENNSREVVTCETRRSGLGGCKSSHATGLPRLK